MVEQYSIVYMSHSCFIHSSIDGHLGCFCILAIVNNAAINIRVLMFFWISVLGSFRHIPRSGTTGSKGRYISNFLRSLHTAFHSGCTSVHSHQECNRVPFSPQPHQHLCVALFIMAILMGVKWYLIAVLICISLMASDAERLFICLWAFCLP